MGIIAGALLYLEKTISLMVEQTSFIVAAVLGGICFLRSWPAFWLTGSAVRHDDFTAVMFVASVALIVISQEFLPLFLGRLLQGMSGGVIAVVVPLYLAECLSAKIRGKGTAIFQFMLTFGIVVAAFLGLYYTRGAESAIAAAAGNEELIRAAQNHAWRGMFWSVIYPSLIFSAFVAMRKTPAAGFVFPSPLLESVYAHFDSDLMRLVIWANQANATQFAQIAPVSSNT